MARDTQEERIRSLIEFGDTRIRYWLPEGSERRWVQWFTGKENPDFIDRACYRIALMCGTVVLAFVGFVAGLIVGAP